MEQTHYSPLEVSHLVEKTSNSKHVSVNHMAEKLYKGKVEGVMKTYSSQCGW